jgi:hypothetical protein
MTMSADQPMSTEGRNVTWYQIFMATVGVVMLGTGIAFGYATFQGDQCFEKANARIDRMNAKIEASKVAPR